MSNKSNDLVKILQRFPDKNPNPVLRFSKGGRLIYSNNPSKRIKESLRLSKNKIPKAKFYECIQKAIKNEEHSFEFIAGKSIYNLKAVYIKELDCINIYGTEVTAKKVIDKFPDKNPNPVIRVDKKGIIIYYNSASSEIIKAHKLKLNKMASNEMIQSIGQTLLSNKSTINELKAGKETFLLTYVPINEFDSIIIYGTNITANKLITKFPDQNPNPVMRVSSNGTLKYFNKASKYIIKTWKIVENEILPKLIIDNLFSGEKNNIDGIELPVGSKIYLFNIVKLEELSIYLLYGTDITDSKDKEMILSKLSKYFSPQVYKSIFTGKLDVNINTNRKNLTVFFSDIKGFTTITEILEPEKLTEVITFYLTEMTNIAHEYGGTVDKYIGDAIMIFFGDPNTNGVESDAINCVSMALKMQKRLIQIRKKWQMLGITQSLEVRMGIHTDVCTVGNFGSNDRLDYTVLGNGVNLASRLESLADPNQILISENTFNIIKKIIRCEYQNEIVVKGKSHPIKTYQVEELLKNQNDDEIIDFDIDGFSISLDKNKVIDKEIVLKYLKKSLKELD